MSDCPRFSRKELNCLRDVADFLDGSNLEPGFKNVLEGYKTGWKFKNSKSLKPEIYLNHVYHASLGIDSMDSFHRSQLKPVLENQVLRKASKAYKKTIEVGNKKGINPILDQPYNHRRKEVLNGVKIANKYNS